MIAQQLLDLVEAAAAAGTCGADVTHITRVARARLDHAAQRPIVYSKT